MTDISLDIAQLVALFIEAMFYGAFVVLFSATVWVLVDRMGGRQMNYRMLATVSIMFLLATAHVSIDMSKVMEAFSPNRTISPVVYYQNLANPKQVAKTAVYGLQTIFGDLFVIYRTYMVWGRNIKIVILPLMLLLGSVLTDIGVTIAMARSATHDSIFSSSLSPWISSFLALSLGTNIYCTSMIAGRIWWTTRRTVRYGAVVLRAYEVGPLMAIVIESGAIYSASLVTLLAVYYSKSNGQYAALDLVTPLIGIAFSMIIVRVHLRGAEKVSSSERHQVAPPAAMDRPPDFGRRSGLNNQLKPIAVNVSQYIHHHADGIELESIDHSVSDQKASDASTVNIDAT